METKSDQFADWLAANENSAFPPNIEGYWRPALELPAEASAMQAGKDFFYWDHNKIWKFPFPVVYMPEAYNQHLFLLLLEEMEKSPFTKKTAYRGYSKHRLTGESNGNSTYEREDWSWPEGYINYIKLGVPPSRAFYKFITTVDCPELPSYGRE